MTDHDRNPGQAGGGDVICQELLGACARVREMTHRMAQHSPVVRLLGAAPKAASTISETHNPASARAPGFLVACHTT